MVVVQFMFNVEPALALGGVLSTVTVTTSVAVQPLGPVTVNVYVVVELGLADVVAEFGLLNPDVGLQLYEFEPPVDTPIETLEKLQSIDPLLPALALGGVLSTVTVTMSVAVHEGFALSVTVNVYVVVLLGLADVIAELGLLNPDVGLHE